MRSKIFIFTTLILVVSLFVITSCDNFLNAKNKTTININLDLSKILKTSRNETTTIPTEYILKVFAYNAATYKPEDEIQNLPLLTQSENKVDINGNVKASLDIEIGLNVILVGKLYEVGAENPIYSGNSEVIKIKATDNKVHLVLTRENADLDIDILVHDHTFATDWTSDATHHWHAATCEHTTEVSGKAAHSFGDWTTTKEATEEVEGTREKSCTVCGYKVTEAIAKLEHKHTYSEDRTSDATHHWHAATCEHTTEVSGKAAHSFGDWTTTKEATEEVEGTREKSCTVCGYKATEVIQKLDHTHTFATDWTKDATNHWHVSTCGHEVTDGKAVHTFGEWQVTKEASCIENGERKSTCTVCDFEKTEVSDKAEHTFGDWTTTKAATEEAEGTRERSCTICGYTATEAIAKLAHTHKFATDWTKDETNHWYASTCGHTTEVSGKAAHSFDDWTVTKAATEEAEGTRERSCTICGYTATEVIEKLAHTHKFATDWTKNETHHWHDATCEDTDETSGFAEHSFGAYVSNNDATTEKDGTKTRKCSVCEYKDTMTDEGSKIIVPEMVSVKGGTVTVAPFTNYESVFIYGRTVTLSDFYMGKYEVTQEEYASVMEGQKVTVEGVEYTLESNPSYCTADSTIYTLFNGDVQEKRPVEGVTWYDSVWYCNALSEKAGLTKAYNIEVTQVKQASGKTGYYIYSANVTLNKDANGYRLPTEAEWEYAARGGDPTKEDWHYMFSGADTAEGVDYDSLINAGLDSVGWYSYNSIDGTTRDTKPSKGEQGYGTHQVGKKAPNRLGLYDMSGNVAEWCYDWHGTITTTTPADGAVSGSYRVGPGGSWYNGATFVSIGYRTNSEPNSCSNCLGFRVVRIP